MPKAKDLQDIDNSTDISPSQDNIWTKSRLTKTTWQWFQWHPLKKKQQIADDHVQWYLGDGTIFSKLV